MKEILLDTATHDIKIEDGKIATSTDSVESLSQRLKITLDAWEGEWILNTAFGIPYRQNIFVAGATKQSVDAIFLRELLAFDEITEIVEFTSTFNKVTRDYEIERLIVRTTDGTVETISLADPDRYDYTFIPQASYSVCTDVVDVISVIMQAGEPTAICGEPNAQSQPLP